MADSKKFKMERLEDRITPSYFQPGCGGSDHGSSHKHSSHKHSSKKHSSKKCKGSSHKKKGNNGFGNGGRDGSPNGKQDYSR